MHVGEHFILGFKGRHLPAWVQTFAERFGLGGVILFDYDCEQQTYGRNITSPQQLRALNAELNTLAAKPLVFIDQEGGSVRRLKAEHGFSPYPSAKEFSKLSWRQRLTLTNSMFAELRSLGIHYNLAPVLDFDHDANPNIGALGRAYAANPAIIKENIAILHRAAVVNGIGLCLKHYPGIGAATVDSHRQLMRLEVNPIELEQFHQLGYQVHGQAILLSHALVQGWNDTPVSLSEFAVQKLRARGHDMLLISDDLQMQGMQLRCNTSTAVITGLTAGVDMLIIGNNLRNEEEQATAWAETLAARATQDHGLYSHLLASQQRIVLRKKLFI
ncbi:MAG: glycoside hydrolase family 3 protein [Pseudomonadota bacterium]|nr:glycoside hydrolase family 3 protein [Pseudomonadota bacterium]